jgi:serine/threonine protein kinase
LRQKNKKKNNPRNELNNNSGKRMDEKSVVMPRVHNKVSMQNFDTDCDSSAKPSSRVFAQKPRLSPGLINLDENKFISYVVKKGNLRPVDDRLGKVGDFKEATSSFVETSHDSFKVSLNRKEYMKVGMLGKGGSSCVYRVLAPDGNFFAYKRVEIRNGEDGENLCESYINEIRLLQKLKGSPHIIELMDADIDKEQMYIAMVMEVGEIDLAKVLQEQSQQVKKCAENNSSVELSSLSPFFIRMVWQEMLEAVDYIHKNRIVHGDLKPANFVFVKGHLKLIDFGIAKAFSNDTTNIYRDSQIGTINYMAPEAICPFEAQSDMDSSDDSFDDDTIAFKSIDGKSKNKSCFGNGSKGKMKMGRASDIWSMGCILYQLLYGRPPFSALSTIQKLQAIPNPNFPIPYPNHIDIHGIDAVQACLQRNVSSRANIRGDKGLLCMNFLQIFPSASSSRSLSPPSSTYNLSKENIQKIIEMVSASGSIAMNCFNVDKLHHQAIQILKGEDIVIPSHAKIIKPDDSVERDELAEDKVVAVSSASCVGPLPDDIENQKPFNANSSDCFTSTILNRKPMATIPLSLSEQIQSKLSGKLALKSITESSQVNAKYINRSTPNNKGDDMQAALEKKLAQMRNFIRVEEMDSDEDDTGTGSDFNASTRNL